jgi:RNA polymerase sigma-54 factor
MLKPSLQLKLTQQLTMTPQLQQAIRLLQLPIMELQTQIQTALDENDVEVEEPKARAKLDAAPAEADSDEPEDYAELAVATEPEWEDTQKTGPSEAPKSAEPPTSFEYADRSEETLRDHLLWQLELENLDPRTTAIGQAIIDAINDDGYLTDDLETIRGTLTPDVLASTEEIEQVLVKLVQQFDPVGVGARSVSECVQLQLGQLDPDTPGLALAKSIAAEHLPLVAEHQYGALKRVLHASDQEVATAVALVRACQPRPGASVFAPAAKYVVPDVFVHRHEGQWVVELNNAMSPQLKVNQLYAGSLGRGEEYDALKAQLRRGAVVDSQFEIRNETLPVALTIAEQTQFLEQGEEHMRPMVLRDVANHRDARVYRVARDHQ